MKGNNKIMVLNKKLSSPRGFTLVEMIVVIGLMGIIISTALAIINPFAQLQKANDAHRKSDLEQLQHAVELYYQDKGSYPQSSANFQIMNGATTVGWGNTWSPYMTTLPKDPTFSNTYVYYSPASSNGQTYYIYANLERGTTDKQACNSGNACQSIGSAAGFPTANACGGVCNYGVSSSNVSP